MPVQPPPLQPAKVEPAAGVAVKVTAVPTVNEAEQAAPQEIPEGALVTVPLPVPVLVTLRAKDCWTNPAVTLVAAVSVTVQVPVPEQPPPVQPTVGPPEGRARRDTPDYMVAVSLVHRPIPERALFPVREKAWEA